MEGQRCSGNLQRLADAAGRHPFGSCLDQQSENSEPSFLGERGERNYGGI
jgi:hypothetical protein